MEWADELEVVMVCVMLVRIQVDWEWNHTPPSGMEWCQDAAWNRVLLANVWAVRVKVVDLLLRAAPFEELAAHSVDDVLLCVQTVDVDEEW